MSVSSCSSVMEGWDSIRLLLMPRWTDALIEVEVDISLSGSNRLNMVLVDIQWMQ